MKYLDEDILVNFSFTATAEDRFMIYRIVKGGQNIYVGQAFVAAGQNKIEFFINDIVKDYRYDYNNLNGVKYSEITGIKQIDTYKVYLQVSDIQELMKEVEVNHTYRYITGLFDNFSIYNRSELLQGDLYPIFPYTITDNYMFSILFYADHSKEESDDITIGVMGTDLYYDAEFAEGVNLSQIDLTNFYNNGDYHGEITGDIIFVDDYIQKYKAYVIRVDDNLWNFENVKAAFAEMGDDRTDEEINEILETKVLKGGLDGIEADNYADAFSEAWGDLFHDISFNATTDIDYKLVNEGQIIAKIDKDCLSDYYVMWVDRMGGIQS